MGRNTQGVRLIKLDAGERLIGVEAVTPDGDDEGEVVEGLPDADKTDELPVLG
jgi:DNA gyrase subunit A